MPRTARTATPRHALGRLTPPSPRAHPPPSSSAAARQDNGKEGPPRRGPHGKRRGSKHAHSRRGSKAGQKGGKGSDEEEEGEGGAEGGDKENDRGGSSKPGGPKPGAPASEDAADPASAVPTPQSPDERRLLENRQLLLKLNAQVVTSQAKIKQLLGASPGLIAAVTEPQKESLFALLAEAIGDAESRLARRWCARARAQPHGRARAPPCRGGVRAVCAWAAPPTPRGARTHMR